jgi:hypothetical protein
MLKTNKEQCVMQSIAGRVHHPIMVSPWRVGGDGKGRIVPATGGITYKIEIGDSCMGLAGDHIEPGISSKNADEREDRAYNHLACIGNEAIVMTGDAKGAKGAVTGKHGGIDHVMIYFDQDTLDKMMIDDKILVKAHGQGLELLDYPDVHVLNIDPELFDKLGIEEKDGQLYVPVVTTVPAELMGSGLGSGEMKSGDYDIMTRDPETYAKYNLGDLRFGDFVYIQDHSCVYGPDYLKGSASVGVVIHGDSFSAGHGPGLAIVLTSQKDLIKPKMDPTANIAKYLK